MVVTEARSVGKSTLVRLVVEQLGGSYLTLDDPLTLSEAAGDADGLVASTTGLTVIDEVQRVPDVLRAVKLSVDRDPTPGRFLLTGSANLLGMRAVTESLAGRAVYLDLLPLSWSESVGSTRPHTIDQAFSAQSADEFAASLLAVGPGAGEEARRRPPRPSRRPGRPFPARHHRVSRSGRTGDRPDDRGGAAGLAAWGRLTGLPLDGPGSLP